MASPDLSRVWLPADRAAGVIPLSALRFHGKEAVALVMSGTRLTVLRYGRAVALLVPVVYPPSESHEKKPVDR